jgi:putative ABC transport system permease protein
MMESLLRDFRIAIRGLARNPGFTAVAVITLALGIGATTTVFSVVYGVLLRPLPFPGADRFVEIVQVVVDRLTGETERMGLTPEQFLNLQDQATLLQGIGIFGAHAPRTLTGIPIPARLNGAGVSADLFDALGVRPLRGRALQPEDSDRGADPVVVLSEGTWATYFGRRDDILESRISLGDVPTRVVGVMPAAFTFPSLASESMSRNSAGEIEDIPEFWIPGSRFERTSTAGGFSIFQAHAVLKPGVRYEQALQEVRTLIGPLPDKSVPQVELVNARTEMGARTSRALAIFQLGVVLVLLIACVNVVNLMLTRAATRRRELAVRMALGASRTRIVREGIAEAIALSIVGGALGCVLAFGLVESLRALPPHVFPRLREIHVDATVLAFALGLSVVTGLAVGLVSSLRVARASVMSQLRPLALYVSAGVTGVRLRPSSVLVIVEIAATVVMLSAGGLLLNSFVRFVRVDVGYDPRDVVSMEVSLPKSRYGTPAAREQFYRDVATRLRGLPGVDAAAATDGPVTHSPFGSYPLTIDGTPAATKETEIRFRRVSPDFFRTLRIPLIEGREFRDEDWTPIATKVIVNRAFAQAHFPHTSPIGHRIQWQQWKDLEIIGVVSDARERPDGEIQRSFYLPIDAGGFLGKLVLLLRSNRDTADMLTAARGVLAEVDPQVAAYDVASLQDILKHAAASPRLYGVVAFASALIALALSAIGLYGVLAYSVGFRTHEFGIRIALGAEARAVRWQVLRQGLGLTIVGLAIGLAGSYASVQALTSLLFGVTARDMTTFTIAAALLVATAVIACLVPSIRATRVDPVVALRSE